MRPVARTALTWGFGIAGALLLGFCAYRILDARFFQVRESMHLEEMLRSESPRNVPVFPARRPPRKAGSLVGKLEIPRLHVSVVVLEGADDRTLDRGVGRISQTAEAGADGNVGLAGHRDTFFRPLRSIRQGDRITLTTPEGRYHYAVDWTRVVRPDAIEVLEPTAEHALTLVTCYPFSYIGSAPERFVVRARQLPESELTSPARLPY